MNTMWDLAMHGHMYAWLYPNSIVSIINTSGRVLPYKSDGDARGKIQPPREIGFIHYALCFPTKMLGRPSKSH